MKIMGIDPGNKGGMAIVTSISEYECYGFATRTMPEIAKLIEEKSKDVDMVFLEKVWSRKGQGVKSTFTFGDNFGNLKGILNTLNIKYELVTPQTWQKKLNCLTKGDKKVSKEKAQQLFPKIKKITDQTADALLIAEYGRRACEIWDSL